MNHRYRHELPTVLALTDLEIRIAARLQDVDLSMVHVTAHIMKGPDHRRMSRQ